MNCESIQEKLLDLLYEEESADLPLLKEHLATCSSCSADFDGLKAVQNTYKALKDPLLPSHLTQAVLQEFEQTESSANSFFAKWTSFVLHPAVAALLIFSLTVGVSYSVKDYFKKNQQTALVMPEEISSPPFLVRMVDWSSDPKVLPDLDRPVLKTAELPSLEQASVESMAAFKHQRAIHYITDGDDQSASKLLSAVIENDLNYSHWDQAVVQHLALMKKMGRHQEMKKDLARLKEYASMNQEMIARAELMVMN